MEFEHAPGRDDATEELRDALAARLQSAAHLLELYRLIECEWLLTDEAHVVERHAQDLRAGRIDAASVGTSVRTLARDGTRARARDNDDNKSVSLSSSSSSLLSLSSLSLSSAAPATDAAQAATTRERGRCLDERAFAFGVEPALADIFGPSVPSDLV